MSVEPDESLTGGLAQGKNIPRQKSPSSGPPTMPKMLIAACRKQGWKKNTQVQRPLASPALPQSPLVRSVCLSLLSGTIRMQESRGQEWIRKHVLGSLGLILRSL